MKFLHKLKNELIGSGIYKFRHYGPRPLCFTAKEENSTIRIRAIGKPTLYQNFQYSYDRTTWLDYTLDTTIILKNINDKVYFKGDNLSGLSESYANGIYFKFEMTGLISASGNIMSLLDNGRCELQTIPNDFCFMYLFSGCTALITAPELPATKLTTGCYYKMFQYCSSLITAPELPATSLTPSCYSGLFNNCSLLTTMPILNALELAENCYSGMFAECTNLINITKLPATKLYNQCYYYMFGKCTSLETVPVLPAIELSPNCYDYMFFGCTNLIINDNISTETEEIWSFGPFINKIDQQNMFNLCLGHRESNNLKPELDQINIYYIKNQPV